MSGNKKMGRVESMRSHTHSDQGGSGQRRTHPLKKVQLWHEKWYSPYTSHTMVGVKAPMTEMTRSTDETPATAGLNRCSLYLIPPASCPINRNQFPS
jgi:hypothetical protein